MLKCDCLSKHAKVCSYTGLDWSVLLEVSPRFSQKWSAIPFVSYRPQEQIQTQVLKLYSLINGHSIQNSGFGTSLNRKIVEITSTLLKSHQCSNCVEWRCFTRLLRCFPWAVRARLSLKMTSHHWYKTLQESMGIEDLG